MSSKKSSHMANCCIWQQTQYGGEESFFNNQRNAKPNPTLLYVLILKVLL